MDNGGGEESDLDSEGYEQISRLVQKYGWSDKSDIGEGVGRESLDLGQLVDTLADLQISLSPPTQSQSVSVGLTIVVIHSFQSQHHLRLTTATLAYTNRTQLNTRVVTTSVSIVIQRNHTIVLHILNVRITRHSTGRLAIVTTHQKVTHLYVNCQVTINSNRRVEVELNYQLAVHVHYVVW